MTIIGTLVADIPLWVWCVFGYVVYLGFQARKPREMVARIALVGPSVALAGGAVSYYQHLWHTNVVIFVGAIVAGAIIGWLSAGDVRVDRDRGVVHLPGDKTVLPIVISFFVIKFCVSYVSTAYQFVPWWFELESLVLSAWLVGFLVGKQLMMAKTYLKRTSAEE